MINTYSTKTPTLLTIEDLKKMTLRISKMESKPLPKGLNWFSRLMNKFGWHRKYEILIFDKSQIGFYNSFYNKIL